MSKHTIQAIKNTTANFYQNLLWSDKGKKALDYIYSRGITDDTIRNMCIGYSPGDNSLKTYLENQGFDPFLSVDSGVLSPSKSGYHTDYFRDYVVFPLFIGTDVSTFTGRSLNKNPKYRYKHLHLKKAQKSFYNYNIISKSKVVMIVESSFNALSLIEWDYPAVATLGASSFKPEHAGLLKNKYVWIIYDNDKNGSGQRAAIKTASILYEKEKVNPYIVLMPEGVDINDYFISYNKSKFVAEILSERTLFSKTKEFNLLMEEIRRKAMRPRYDGTKDDDSIKAVNQIPIADVVRLFNVDLKRFGNNYKAICPFTEHNEEMESFTVYSDSNTIKCYGCGFFGDNIEFVRKMNGMKFKEAIKFLEKSFFIKKEERNGKNI